MTSLWELPWLTHLRWLVQAVIALDNVSLVLVERNRCGDQDLQKFIAGDHRHQRLPLDYMKCWAHLLHMCGRQSQSRDIWLQWRPLPPLKPHILFCNHKTCLIKHMYIPTLPMHLHFVTPLWASEGLVKKFGALMVEIKTEKGYLFLLDLELDFGFSFFSMSLTSMLGRREISNQLLLHLRRSRVRFKNVLRNG